MGHRNARPKRSYREDARARERQRRQFPPSDARSFFLLPSTPPLTKQLDSKKKKKRTPSSHQGVWQVYRRRHEAGAGPDPPGEEERREARVPGLRSVFLFFLLEEKRRRRRETERERGGEREESEKKRKKAELSPPAAFPIDPSLQNQPANIAATHNPQLFFQIRFSPLSELAFFICFPFFLVKSSRFFFSSFRSFFVFLKVFSRLSPSLSLLLPRSLVIPQGPASGAELPVDPRGGEAPPGGGLGGGDGGEGGLESGSGGGGGRRRRCCCPRCFSCCCRGGLLSVVDCALERGERGLARVF